MDYLHNRNLDQQLQRLAMEAQQHPPRSKGRQRALTKLAYMIQRSGRLYCQNKDNFPPDVYYDALQELWLYICKNIDTYNPERSGVITWANFILNKRFINVLVKYNNKKIVYTPDLSDLDKLERPENIPLVSEEVKQCIEEDPEGLFKKEHIQNYQKVNFQALVKRRLLGESWQEISATFGGIKVATLSSFYQRSLNKLCPKVREYLQG